MGILARLSFLRKKAPPRWISHPSNKISLFKRDLQNILRKVAMTTTGSSNLIGKRRNSDEIIHEKPNKIIKNESGTVKLMSWNVASINACLKKGFLDLIKNENADIFCIQETKANAPAVYVPKDLYPYQYHSICTRKKGYSGTALFSKIEPLCVTYEVADDEFKDEGRYIVAEFEEYFLACAYVPNAGQKLERLALKREHSKKTNNFLKNLSEKKAVIFCGDLNVAHKEIDLTNPKTNKRTAGFTDEEREDFSKTIKEVDLIDSYRLLHPDETDKFSYYGYRGGCYKKNIGWRLDYFLVSSVYQKRIIEADILSSTYGGSDHVPIVLKLSAKGIS